jgi:hypothetical protein
MWHSGFDLESTLVQSLELLVVLRLGEHLDFECVDLKRVCAFARIVGAIFSLTGFV